MPTVPKFPNLNKNSLSKYREVLEKHDGRVVVAHERLTDAVTSRETKEFLKSPCFDLWFLVLVIFWVFSEK